MNVPKLRFKEFTDEWIKIDLSTCFEYFSTNSLSREQLSDHGIIKNIHYGDIHKKYGNVVDVENDVATYIKDTEQINKYEFCCENDIIFADASEDYDGIGKAIELINVNEKLVSGLHTIHARDKKQFFSPLFKGYYFNTPIIHNQIRILANGFKVFGISKDNINNLKVMLPSKQEQDKIAKLLSLLDKKIELQAKKIEDLKLFKKGLLNSFFQNKQPNVTIENCISYGKAGGTPSSKNKDYYDGNIPFLSISDMTSQKKYILKTEKSISQQGIKNSSAWIVPKNSIILSMYASYGLIAINKIELATSQAMFSMIVNSKNNIEYIYYYLEFLYNNSYYDRLVSIGTQANLNADKVKKIKIYLPDINSQNQISKILKLCDERIEYENKKEFELRKFKQGLLQNLFI